MVPVSLSRRTWFSLHSCDSLYAMIFCSGLQGRVTKFGVSFPRPFGKRRPCAFVACNLWQMNIGQQGGPSVYVYLYVHTHMEEVDEQNAMDSCIRKKVCRLNDYMYVCLSTYLYVSALYIHNYSRESKMSLQMAGATHSWHSLVKDSS